MTERILRGGLIALLLLLLLRPGPWDRSGGGERALHLRGSLDSAGLVRVLRDPPRVILRDAPRPPDGSEMERLRAAARSVPLVVALPRTATLLEAAAPTGLRAGRTAAIGFRLRGAPGDTARLELRDRVGVIDSAAVALDSAGQASGAFRVRPRAPGWQEWTLAWRDGTRTVGAWADSAAAPRVLVHAGLPGWEAKFLARALEESGATTSARYDLGRGLAVSAGAPGLTAAALQAADVVVVLDGAPLSAAQAELLRGWVERGGGLLLTGDRAAVAAGLVGRAGPAAPLVGEAVRWQLPPEIAPLPRVPLRATANLLEGGSSEVLASSAEGAVLVARPVGAGRAAALALGDTWRWRLEAGRVAEHREFWRSLVDHLAGDASGARLTVGPNRPAAGAPVEIAVWDPTGGAVPRAARVVGARGEDDRVELHAGSDGVARGRYHPPAPGVYRVEAAGRTGGFGVGGGEAPGGWGEVALLAAGSGGAAVPAGSAAAVVDRLAPAGDRPWRPSRGLLLGAVVVLAGAGWALRRLRGRP